MVLLARAHEPVEEAGLFVVGPVLCALGTAVAIVGIGVVLGGLAAAFEGVCADGVGGLALEGGGRGAGECEGRVGGGRRRLGRRVRGGAEVAGAGVRLRGTGQVRTQRLAEAVLVEGGLGRRAVSGGDWGRGLGRTDAASMVCSLRSCIGMWPYCMLGSLSAHSVSRCGR